MYLAEPVYATNLFLTLPDHLSELDILDKLYVF